LRLRAIQLGEAGREKYLISIFFRSPFDDQFLLYHIPAGEYKTFSGITQKYT
jgi:hypothetical protein